MYQNETALFNLPQTDPIVKTNISPGGNVEMPGSGLVKIPDQHTAQRQIEARNPSMPRSSARVETRFFQYEFKEPVRNRE
jgi:hypothetical protein